MKKLFLCCLICTSVISYSNYALANDLQDTVIINSIDAVDDSNRINSRASSVPLNVGLNGSSGNQSNSFSVNSSMPHYKVWVSNTSSADYTVTVTNGSPTGAVQNTFTVRAGSNNEIRMQANSFGLRYVNITSRNGVPLRGQLSVRVASTSSELG